MLCGGKPVMGHGWCNAHYKRWQKYGDPLGAMVKSPCIIEGCETPVAPKSRAGLCRYHGTRAWKKAHAEAVNAHNRRYNARKPEVMRRSRAGWAAAHPESPAEIQQTRRARKKGQFVEKVYKTKVLKLRGTACGICSESVDPKTFQLDHIVPLALGGEHSYANCQPAHGQNCRNSQGVACNQAKAAALDCRTIGASLSA